MQDSLVHSYVFAKFEIHPCLQIILTSFFALLTASCEINTKLNVTGTNAPVFQMTGNGGVLGLRVRGHKRQRDIEGEAGFIYWLIGSQNGEFRTVGQLRSIQYGHVPVGYHQIYPENGSPPPLEEGQHYYVGVNTANANGDDGYFMILNGKVHFAKHASQLPVEIKPSQ